MIYLIYTMKNSERNVNSESGLTVCDVATDGQTEIAEQTQSADVSDCADSGGAACQSADAACGNKPRKPRRRIINTVSRRTTLNYIVFSLILLAVLWIAFFIMLYGFYDTILKHDIEDVGHIAASAFPKQSDSNGMQLFYKHRLPEIARDNSVTVTVFTLNENGDAEVEIMVDNMGNGIDESSDVFDAVMIAVNFNATFAKNSKAQKVDTSLGVFLCFGSRHEVKHADGSGGIMYMLVLKHYDVINPQTNKILYMLILCTFIVLVFTCVFSYFVSRFQTKQLKDFSQKAKRLADGEINVMFSGSGYEEFESLATALNAATDKYEKSEKLQRDIIANVSHDIRTPLTMIRAYAEMLRDMPVDDDKRKKTAGVIISETERLAALTADMLNYSKLQSGVVEFKFEPCDISQIARSVLMQFDIYSERDGIKFLSEIDKKAIVNCDKPRIEQVLYNLIINAINYCGDDKTIIVRVTDAQNKVRVEVEDHGKGISPQEIDAVWDRYYRTAHAARAAVGSGLGLSICKNILAAHDAQFGVLSEQGKGSVFWFELNSAKIRGGGGGGQKKEKG